MTPLEQRIRDRIAREGPLPVCDYMAMALGDPEFGYYVTRDPFGVAGDFITAPEICQVFGELIGLWCAVAWEQAGAPDRAILAELGPGRGTLMADALRAAAMSPSFSAAIELHLVETSPKLRDCQRAALDGHHVTWHDRFEDVPPGPLFLIANEFFDALPIDQFVKTEAGWRRRCVAVDPVSNKLSFVVADSSAGEGPEAPLGAIREANPSSVALAGDIGGRLSQFGGAALIIDYGPAESAVGDSLQAVSRQQYHDVLQSPGEADITAHVDFQELGRAARAAGAATHGPIPQAAFCSRLGIGPRTENLLESANAEQAASLRAATKRLIDPAAMGTLFKALALTGPNMPPPAGFEEDAHHAE
jgi:NADH dehydrogenase [ubiquinone] 1 alpha subcomplex assembly factor 7